MLTYFSINKIFLLFCTPESWYSILIFIYITFSENGMAVYYIELLEVDNMLRFIGYESIENSNFFSFHFIVH
jgi:hypothetical protein